MLAFAQGQAFSIARIHYSGGGDWYSDPSSLPNLISYIEKNKQCKKTEKHYN